MLIHKAAFAVRHCASKDETRYNLNGLNVTPEGVVEATDGHRLARFRPTETADESTEWPTLPDGSGEGASEPLREGFILPRDAADRVLRSIPQRCSVPIVSEYAQIDGRHANENGHVRIVTTDLESATPTVARKIEGEFPNTDAVIPKEKADRAATVNARYLMDACKVAIEASGRSGRASAKKDETVRMRLEIRDDSTAVAIRSEASGGELLQLVMPMRVRGASGFMRGK